MMFNVLFVQISTLYQQMIIDVNSYLSFSWICGAKKFIQVQKITRKNKLVLILWVIIIEVLCKMFHYI